MTTDDKIIRFPSRPSPDDGMTTQQVLDKMSDIEDLLESMDEFGVTTRDELQALLNELDSRLPDSQD